MDALTPERAGELLPAHPGTKALVIGDLMIDRYIVGSVERVSPEAPVPVVHVAEERSVIGGAGNVAANLSALGLTCTIVGCVGPDADAAALRDALGKAGVDLDGVVEAGDRRTTVKTRVVAGQQQIVRFDHEDTSEISGSTQHEVLNRVRELCGRHDVVVIGDYNKGVVTGEVISAVLEGAAARGVPVVVDPKRRHFLSFSGATVFKPNARELADAFGEPVQWEDESWMEEVRTRVGCQHLVLTLGSRGIALQSAAGELTHVPAVAREVFDVSGAGDTVSAVIGAALAAGGSPLEAAILANHAAAVCVSRTGVTPVSRTEVLDSVSREHVTKSDH